MPKEKNTEEKKTEQEVEEKKNKENTEEKISEAVGKVRASDKKTEGKTGIVYIYTSFNNTILHVTDMAGNTISKVSGGMTTKHNRLKANPTVAMFVAKRLAEDAKNSGITSLYVRIKAKTGNPAPGPGAHASIKSLSREGIKIISIADTTRVPRGGPKKKGGRRGRRV